MKKKINSKKGYSLVEILVSIGILVSISAMITKVLFDFTNTAYMATSQIKSNQELRNIFGRLEKIFVETRGVLISYKIGSERNYGKELKNCEAVTGTHKYISYYKSFDACSLNANSNLQTISSNKKVLVLTSPVENRCDFVDAVTPVCTSLGFQDLSAMDRDDYFFNKTGGGFLTKNPRNQTFNDVFILYKDNKNNFRIAEFPSLAATNNAASPYHQKPYSRTIDPITPTTILYKTDVVDSVKLASNIINGVKDGEGPADVVLNASIPGSSQKYTQADVRSFTDDIFTYFTDSKEYAGDSLPIPSDTAGINALEPNIIAIRVKLKIKPQRKDTTKSGDDRLNLYSKEAIFKFKNYK